jgi:uncharacterized protein YgiM (DUF1202 family)
VKKFLFALCIFLLAGASATADNAPSPVTSSFSAGPNEAMVILNQLGLYTESGGVLTLKEGLILGDKLAITGKVQKFKVDKNEREYIKVRAPSGVEGWVRAPYALPKVTLAVVKSDAAMVYAQARDVSVTDQTISPMTVVAVFQEGGTAQFMKVNCYDAVKNAYFTETDKVFLPKEDLSFSEIDINAVIVYTTALANKNKTVRTNLFKVIEKKYSGSQFFEKIRSVLAPESVPTAKATVPAAGSFVVNDDNVNVRSSPDEVNGPVVAKLSRGTQVEAIEATAQSYSIGGLSAAWYKIQEPAGWVFGSFLTPIQ